MVIKPIKNERDYKRTLAAIDKLMDAKPKTPEGDHLDVLVALVCAWEEQHYPIPCSDCD